ncbi:MAG TPA: ABC transporter permease [Candidatus Krumholzibacterium sp.]|nr:ABC transporter permease [Candidatus Krumholzibacterium sp.]
MGSRIIKRVAYSAVIVVLISILAFSMMHLAPGGPVGVLTGNPKVTGEDLSRIRASYGLDRPLPVQYLCWFRQVILRFDFGTSYVTGRDVSAMIVERVPATLELMLAAFMLALAGACIAGVLAAVYRDSLVDQLVSIFSVGGMSVPVFWTGVMAIYLFSVRLGVLPAGGRFTYGAESSLRDHLVHLALPAVVLSFSYFGSWARYIRGGLIEAFEGDFIVTARAKGLGTGKVVFKHALRNAVLPAVTVMVMQIPTMFTGAVITETVFSWPGMGRLFFEGLQRHDHTRVLGVIVVSAILIVFFNLAGDILGMMIDPRMERRGGDEGREGAGRTKKGAMRRGEGAV